jgi:PTH1 family peptidyl-tRNA hydrolase
MMGATERHESTAACERFLIVGLGNPGPDYARNRHNVGFQVVDRLAEALGARFASQSRLGLVAKASIAGRPVIIEKPRTFMNLSGDAVAAAAHWYKIEAERCLLVVYDDLDLPPGKIRLRPHGGAGGHKGIRSIIDALHTQDFPRLRVGIGRPTHGEPYQWVLNDFSRSEDETMARARDEAVEAIHLFVREGIVSAMNRFNPDSEP